MRDTIEYPQIYFEKGSGLRPVIDQMFEEIGQFQMCIRDSPMSANKPV